ncbi:hypothetical protein TTHERM_000773259 (macronuclear) [Tetrahymena thermophila SB210]|uniref:Uncharacterized protein n=1 Tax=Tetrahymena thermophila (strain SB210) TaxID=312017 RepID=W7X4S3_TETTS|nr:hypothetical protein TTHERM_000773259 [Tetrahymena thermophila SB210]EWS72417.1 hypothetical protein TTHERM_000773259 [Tetrahymena thermophila SB210]|eukprot:XP_012655044.1 hypothetical protein TTHERM_000773259 [Tetrahymena thermophila SB210]
MSQTQSIQSLELKDTFFYHMNSVYYQIQNKFNCLFQRQDKIFYILFHIFSFNIQRSLNYCKSQQQELMQSKLTKLLALIIANNSILVIESIFQLSSLPFHLPCLGLYAILWKVPKSYNNYYLKFWTYIFIGSKHKIPINEHISININIVSNCVLQFQDYYYQFQLLFSSIQEILLSI